nr:unnamed protein product [Naegleria fowleri]
MRKKSKKPFGMNFELIDTLDSSSIQENNAFQPCHITSSYHHSCVLISHQHYNSIHVFDLDTKQFKLAIPWKCPKYLVIEENYRHDALILSCRILKEYFVYKCDLGKLLIRNASENEIMMNEENSYIWRSVPFFSANGVAISRACHQVFVCGSQDHTQCITILDLNSGTVVSTLNTQSCPVGITFGCSGNYLDELDHVEDLLFVSEIDSNDIIEVFEKNNNNSTTINDQMYKAKRLTFDRAIYNACELVFDKISKRLMVADSGNHQILVFDMLGRCIHEFGDVSQFKFPSGMVLNEQNGQVLICDKHNRRVLIFK